MRKQLANSTYVNVESLEFKSFCDLCQTTIRMLDQINQLVSSSAWKTISTIEDWDDYFDDQKNKLETEIELMKAVLENE